MNLHTHARTNIQQNTHTYIIAPEIHKHTQIQHKPTKCTHKYNKAHTTSYTYTKTWTQKHTHEHTNTQRHTKNKTQNTHIYKV